MSEYEPLAPGPSGPGKGGGLGGKKPWLIGCGIGCGVLILVVAGVVVASFLWISKGGELVESGRIPAQDPVTRLDLRLSYDDPGTRLLLDSLNRITNEIQREHRTRGPEWLERLRGISEARQSRSDFGLKMFLPIHLAVVEEKPSTYFPHTRTWVGSCERFGNLYRIFFKSFVGPTFQRVSDIDGEDVYRNEAGDQMLFCKNAFVYLEEGDWERLEATVAAIEEPAAKEAGDAAPGLSEGEEGRLTLTERSSWKEWPALRDLYATAGPGEGTVTLDIVGPDSLKIGIQLAMQDENSARIAQTTLETLLRRLDDGSPLELRFDGGTLGRALQGTVQVAGIGLWYRDLYEREAMPQIDQVE
jgi:hypothetical protein